MFLLAAFPFFSFNSMEKKMKIKQEMGTVNKNYKIFHLRFLFEIINWVVDSIFQWHPIRGKNIENIIIICSDVKDATNSKKSVFGRNAVQCFLCTKSWNCIYKIFYN